MRWHFRVLLAPIELLWIWGFDLEQPQRREQGELRKLGELGESCIFLPPSLRYFRFLLAYSLKKFYGEDLKLLLPSC